jgi:hypothetical protein
LGLKTVSISIETSLKERLVRLGRGAAIYSKAAAEPSSNVAHHVERLTGEPLDWFWVDESTRFSSSTILPYKSDDGDLVSGVTRCALSIAGSIDELAGGGDNLEGDNVGIEEGGKTTSETPNND